MTCFVQKLETAKTEVATQTADAWQFRLERLRGKIGDDGVERLTTQAVFDYLEVAQRSRRTGACRRLAKLMVGLGWTPVRVRGLTRGAYLEQVRGYCRDARNALPARSSEQRLNRHTSRNEKTARWQRHFIILQRSNISTPLSCPVLTKAMCR
jgi:hypothetical protein